jgi:diguanylate cyclase (GGDEF)-like protein
MVRLNGYESEAQMLSEVNDIGREWYVNPQRRDEFIAIMHEQGRVTDLVSEVYRRGTGERIWVSETAWTVRGADGELACYEGTVLDATDRKRAEAQIERAARHDALTDLPNRKVLRQKLEESFATVSDAGPPFALLCLDLDMFKTVNDTLGHPIGDALLVAVSGRIRSNLRKNDVVARLGGDEFALLQVGTEQPQGAGALAKRLVAALARPFNIEGHQVNIGASIGIAVAPNGGSDPDQLLKNADLALYKAKSDGRGQFRFFEPAMDAEVQARRLLELDLRHALAGNEFELHYQPFLDISTGAIVGYEALLRWNHPRRGRLAPAQFMSVAEETGLIVPLGEWAMRQACRDSAAWPRGMRVSGERLGLQCGSSTIMQTVVSALASSGLAPERLELEVTELALMRNSEGCLKRCASSRISAFGSRWTISERAIRA